MRRKEELATNEVYHVFSRSIANFVIFNDPLEYERMLYAVKFYQMNKPLTSFSIFARSPYVQKVGLLNAIESISKNSENIVQIVAFCLMPTHIHFIIKQLQDNGISIFMGNILNSYSRYFNTLHGRKGPLWESKFQNVRVKNDEQLLHLTRYIHLNPVTAFIVDKPEDWKFSSYLEYVGGESGLRICQFKDIIEIETEIYRDFVKERTNYQRELAKIKKLIIE